MEPMETKPLKPTFSRMLQSSTAVHRAPLWLMKATLPGRAMLLAKVAFSPSTGFMTPRQLGPMMRMRPPMVCMISVSSSAPLAPVSLKPAEMTMPPGIPSSTLSLSRAGTPSAGVHSTTRSGTSGSSCSEG